MLGVTKQQDYAFKVAAQYCRLYVDGLMDAETLKGMVLVQICAQAPTLRRKLNGAVRYWRHYNRNAPKRVLMAKA